MFKTLTYAVACIAVALMAAGVAMVRGEGRQAGAPSADFARPSPMAQPRMLKKTELFSQGHAADVVDVEQVWSAYGFYIDAGNGEGAASLYAEDAIIHHYWNDKGTKYEPHGGVGSFQTPYGTTRGGPCVVRGRQQIRDYFARELVTPGPGWGHHTSPNSLVKVSDDGKTAFLTTTMLIASTNEKGQSSVTTGMYRIIMKKTPSEGWVIAEQNNFADRPRGNNRCGENGPLTSK